MRRSFLKELHLTEGRNTGFRKILGALERNGSPKPEFETDEERSYFITRLFIHDQFIGENDIDNDIDNDINVKLIGLSRKKQDNAKKIILTIKDNENISIAELKEITGLSERTIARYLKERNIIERVGPDFGGSWKILKEV